MSLLHLEWAYASAPVLLVGLTVLALAGRRSQRREHAQRSKELNEAREHGTHTARLLHPLVDLKSCIGCGACVRACPEDGVLAMIHGQAAVVHGSRCVGHGECATACPAAAISLTLGDISQRRDLPAIDPSFEAVGVPGLFLAGELSGFALVRNAVAQGTAAADAVAKRVATHAQCDPVVTLSVGTSASKPPVYDLLVVGTGPGGLACALRAKHHKLNFLTIEQEPRIGGTIAAYPRKKMVMTQPLELPLYGRLSSLTYSKEQLVEIWDKAAQRNELPIRTGTRLLDLTRSDAGVFTAETSEGPIYARNVCLALGRRGSPRKLNVPGEALPKVSYGLIDAASYTKRHILVVGGGDSAIEAALALSQQPGNTVTVSYRKAEFTRLKARNATRIARALHGRHLRVLFNSEVTAIDARDVHLRIVDGTHVALPNDDVFVLAGGDPPFKLLERAGVSFDPADRPDVPMALAKPGGLLGALVVLFACAIVVTVWAGWFHAYYGIDPDTRAATTYYAMLRPTGPVGLASGVLACVMFLANLLYLCRRSPVLGRFLPGTRPGWMRFHVFTGLLGVLLVLVHCGFSARPTVGGHALGALLLVIVTGSIGRYLYAMFPRAANGSETTLDGLRTRLASLSTEWDKDGRGFGAEARRQIDELMINGRWRGSFFSRVGVLLLGQWRLRKCLNQLRVSGRSDGVADSELRHVLDLARKAHRLTLLVTHYDELGSVVSTWRYFHRWVGLLVVLLTVVHVVMATRYAGLLAAFEQLATSWHRS